MDAMNGGSVRHLARTILLLVGITMLAACGDTPFASLGERSAEWVTDPTVITTTTIPTTIPLASDASDLIWFNDDLGTGDGDPGDIVSAVFARREGDRFIQASRAEIVAVLDGVEFPTRVPPLAEYVSSQLVIENSGLVSDDPSAAFGIWTAEPYSRSRSVAQLAVLRVFRDADGVAEVAAEGSNLSCARFSSEGVISCSLEDINARPTWVLEQNDGTTLIWYDEQYRYELFGRPFAAVEGLRQTAASAMPLANTLLPDE